MAGRAVTRSDARRPAPPQIARMPDPRYTDDERALILRRAAELQLRQGEAMHALSELERDAAAAGIDPLLVRRVALQLRQGMHGLALAQLQLGGAPQIVGMPP